MVGKYQLFRTSREAVRVQATDYTSGDWMFLGLESKN